MRAVVTIKTIEEAKVFCNIASKYDFDIIVKSGKHAVDGKSILGIFSLDLTSPVEVCCETDDRAKAMEFVRQLKNAEYLEEISSIQE